MAGQFEDRLSPLPDEILLNILSFLPDSRLAAQTSTLSKRWRHLPSRCPVIRLPLAPQPLDVSAATYIPTVDGCLQSYRLRTLRCLALHLPSANLTDPAADQWTRAADRWIRWASKRSIRELRLTGRAPDRCPSWGWRSAPDTAFPSIFSISGTLTSLHLSSCYFRSFPNSLRGFRSLTKLTISDTLLTRVGLLKLLRRCRILESLELYRCSWVESLKLEARTLPKLTQLRVRECEGLVDVNAKFKAPNLRFLYIEGDLSAVVVKGAVAEAKLYGCIQKPFESDMMPLLKSIASVESLSVDNWIFGVKFVRDHPSGATFKNLKKLFCNVEWVTDYMLCTFSSILEECPLLVELNVKLDGNREVVKYWLQHSHHEAPSKFTINEQASYDLIKKNFGVDFEQDGRGRSTLKGLGKSLNHLKYVTIEGFLGGENEMLLVDILLNHAASLKKLVVIGFDGLNPKMVQAQLSQLGQGFPEVQIVLKLRKF